MRIAFVRGPFLNPWELQTYVPLAERHRFTAIGSNWQFYRRPLHAGAISVREAPVWGASLAKIHPSLFVAYNRGLSWTMGRSYGLGNLESIVGEADLIHSAESYTTITHQCLELRRNLSCKVVATVWENLPFMGELHPLRQFRKKRALKELDGFLVATETTRRTLLEEGAAADRIEVIPMGVDVSRFKPAARDAQMTAQWGIRSDERIVLFIGRWVPEKGILDILDAMPQVLRHVAFPTRFCFVGDGPLRSRLESASKKYPGRMLLIPFPLYERELELHNMASVFVLPSKPTSKWEEQYGMVLVESMACGKAIVTTHSGSIPDVVGDAAMRIPPGDVDALAAALIRLLTSDSDRQRLGESARSRALEQFDASKNARRIESFYERILSRNS